MTERKIVSANRLCQKAWKTDIFFIECEGKSACLLCNKRLATKRKSNLSQHYNTYHAETYNTYSPQRRAEIVAELKLQYKNTVEVSPFQTLQSKSLAASYYVALEIARSQKCFSDGKLIKKCAIEMAKAFGNESAVECFRKVSLSQQTVCFFACW